MTHLWKSNFLEKKKEASLATNALPLYFSRLLCNFAIYRTVSNRKLFVINCHVFLIFHIFLCLLIFRFFFICLQILQKFRLEHHGEEVGMIHMPFTTPDKPLNIQFFSRAAENGLAAQKYQTPLVQRHGFASWSCWI